MNFFVISDTHGHLEKVYEMYAKLKDMTPNGKPFDRILHCGDHDRDAHSIGDHLGLPAIAVPGNCDFGGRKDFRVVRTDLGNILMTHGHYQQVDYDTQLLSYLALENDCAIACFGHTHRPVFEETNGVLCVNPGSLSFPRDGTSGSCAILTLDEHGADGGIYYYENVVGQKKKKTSRGGFLRGMVNYSDRF
jgi:putative phosphoesterase